MKIDFDMKGLEEAAKSLSSLTVGPSPSRTNPTGDSRTVIDPRTVLASKLNALVDFCLRTLRANTPISPGEGGGRVRRSYNVRVGGAGGSKGGFNIASYQIASDLPDEEQIIINTLEYGSAPHVIRPKNATFLRFPISPEDFAPGVVGAGDRQTFVIQSDKTYILTTKVDHPGTRPYAMFRITMQMAEPVADGIAEAVGQEVMASFRKAGGSS